jgi:EAL and modified HD-GYP domain-containing signal transduction protein
MSDIFLARQPIYTPELTVHGYELLYRGGNVDYAQILDGEDATSQVLVNALIEIGLPDLVGNHYAFINCTEDYLLQGLPNPIASDQVVLEILEDVLPGPELLQALGKLKAAGYYIALDDFVFHNDKRELVQLADMVKLDVMNLSAQELEQQIEQLRPFKVKLLAEKVETQDDFEHCKKLGFDFFQGFFFCRPRTIQGARTPSSKLAILQLMSKLQDPELGFHELEKLVSNDVSLSYRMLRYINSAMFNLSQEVESIHRAITLLGLSPIKSWVTIMAMSSIDDKPHELMITALIRAHMCQHLAKNLTQASMNEDSAFTVGLFSTLDALMDQPMEKLLTSIPIGTDIKGALLSHSGPMGELLAATLSYEKGNWKAAKGLTSDADILRQAYMDALRAAKEMGSLLEAA